jgi:Na+-driven multidrug efflux pump
LRTLLRLSAPNLAAAAARVTFLTADALFVSWLGSDALAAVSIVFPLLLMVQTSSASGLGAGVSSSIGRALGSGEPETARRLAGTAVALALTAASATPAILLLFGPVVYRTMGANGPTLDLAVRYGAMIFIGIGFVWLMNILANITRGAGNMLVPAFSIVIGETCHLALSPILILGWGPFPPLGIVGAAVGALSAYVLGAAIIGGYLCSHQALTRIEAARIRITAAETRKDSPLFTRICSRACVHAVRRRRRVAVAF